MCGIVGMICKSSFGFAWKDKQMFEQLLYANALRGEDSTGIFGINKYGNLKMHKAAKPSWEFLQTKTSKDFMDSIYKDMRIVVGHNRATTKGATNDTNAHPFIEDHICLIHNGTLLNHDNLAKTEVDSHAIAISMAKRGLKQTIPDINGAYALVWYNAQEKKLYVTRNTQRPLWILETKNAAYIASEPEMLQWVYKRVHGTKEEVKYFDTESVYSWDIEELDKSFKQEPKPKKASVSVVVHQPHLLVQNQHSQSKSSGGYSETQFTKEPYKRGDQVTIESYSNTINGDNVTIYGKSVDNKEVDCKFMLSSKYISAELLAELLDADFIEGTYSGYSVKQGKTTVFLYNPKVATIYTSCNNIVVTDSELASQGYTCGECGTIIDPDEEDGKFWVRVKNAEVKAIKCAYCVDHNEHLRHLIKEDEECTSESQSSDTQQVVDQSSSLDTPWNYM
jgi:predicted glutamine amidotransferase